MANVLITGSTGMIGKGILLECIDDASIETIVLLNRNPIDVKSGKIKEVLLKDFTQIESVKDQLGLIDACFHCMGVSALGLSEEEYSKLTFDVTKALVDICFEINPNMTFNYVSGQGTDSSEKGRQMWARVKGKTENYMLAKGFSKAYAFRPGFIIPERGIRSRTKLYDNIYRVFKPLFPLFKKMKSVTTTGRIAKVMIKTITCDLDNQYLDNQLINKIAKMD
ncbi:MAG: epimerase [Flammeovirgaceae bacterium]|nr:epimerase [Flammeovirgaceae bacterium]MBE61831.1 epimerase [Flammeovirgaceae bacterium]MBR11196.1 epimerase [Rickettsiales bacterium]HCX24581.1 epimerase [Cytophagales bacterium]|tara:strand:+ start:872 stop:1540 length:669 start_codon:yes stop_codon:yes gene_type:complete